MGEAIKLNVTAELRPCWSCARAIVVVNGEVTSKPYVLTLDDERLYITPHDPSCVILRDTSPVV